MSLFAQSQHAVCIERALNVFNDVLHDSFFFTKSWAQKFNDSDHDSWVNDILGIKFGKVLQISQSILWLNFRMPENFDKKLKIKHVENVWDTLLLDQLSEQGL